LVFAVFKSAAEAGENLTYDYVLCAAKALNQAAVVEGVKPLIKSQTTIVIAQNGVGNEDLFRARYPENSIISCAVSPQTTIFVRLEFVSSSFTDLDRSRST
jgi:ketopantoate reductase